MNDITIPPYDPEVEKRGKPKKGKKEVEGIVVGTGETKQVIPPEDLFKLASMGCTDREICDFYGITESTLKFNFSVYLSKARAHLNQRLRKAQLTLALSGNATMLIWLGKQILGQSENPMTASEDMVLPWTTDTE